MSNPTTNFVCKNASGVYQDLSGIFQPISLGVSIGYDTSFNIAGIGDLSTIFASISSGSSIGYNTGLIANNGQDLRQIFAAYNPSSWSQLGSTFSSPFYALTINPSTGYVYAGGFYYQGSTNNHIVFYFDGTSWTSLGGTTTGINSLIQGLQYNSFDGNVYTVGSNNFSVYSYSASSWSQISNTVYLGGIAVNSNNGYVYFLKLDFDYEKIHTYSPFLLLGLKSD